MLFSKTFGYALRGVLYVAITIESKPRVQLEEIAQQLALPRHFMGKVMKKLVKEGVLTSLKGPYGGFCINERTMKTSLLKLTEITGEAGEFTICVLRLGKCNSANPCPMHRKVESIRQQWQTVLSSTTIEDLLTKKQPDFISSIMAV